MNRLFGSFFDTDTVRARGNLQRRWIPPMDLVEDGEHNVLRRDIPGVAQDDVNVELSENVLTISGERRSEHESGKDGKPPHRACVGQLLALADGARGHRCELAHGELRQGRARGKDPQARGSQAAARHDQRRRQRPMVEGAESPAA
jgi:hypothetical protein